MQAELESVTMSLSQIQTKMSSNLTFLSKTKSGQNFGLPGPAALGRTDRAVTVPITVTPAPAESRSDQLFALVLVLSSSVSYELPTVGFPSGGPRPAGRARAWCGPSDSESVTP